MNRLLTITTSFLGISMFMFGALKFVNPFKGWYTDQVTLSELPFPVLSYWSGQLGEIAIGIALLAFVLFKSKITPQFNVVFYLTNLAIVAMMLVAFYVHFHPQVPADILPMKIKAPFIPGFFLVAAFFNIYMKTSLRARELHS